MTPTKITVRLLEKMKPGDCVFDTDVRGLSADMGARGGIRFRFKGERREGPKTGTARAASTVKLTLGTYPEMSLELARQKATEHRLIVKGGQDPRTGTARAPGMWTVATLVKEYLEDQAKTGGAERTIQDVQNRYDDYLAKPWGAMPLTAITPEMARARHEHISKHGKNGDNPAPVIANDTLRNFRAMWNWAKKTQPSLKLPDNPVGAVTFNVQRGRTDSLILSVADLPAWETRVAAIKNPIRRDMHRFGLFSGLRPGTLVLLEREWVRFDLKAIMIPASAMKKRKEFHLPLSGHMMDLLRRIMAAGDVLFPAAPYLFPTRGNKTRIGPVIATQVWKEKGMASETGHILRHLYSNACQAAGSTDSPISDVERMLLLAQKVPGIKGAYLNSPFLFKSLLAKQEQVTAFLLEATGVGSAPKEEKIEKKPAKKARKKSSAK